MGGAIYSCFSEQYAITPLNIFLVQVLPGAQNKNYNNFVDASLEMIALFNSTLFPLKLQDC